MLVTVEDDAGAYCEKINSDGLGMNIVDKRIKSYFGRQYGTRIDCVPGSLTRVQLTCPYEQEELS